MSIQASINACQDFFAPQNCLFLYESIHAVFCHGYFAGENHLVDPRRIAPENFRRLCGCDNIFVAWRFLTL